MASTPALLTRIVSCTDPWQAFQLRRGCSLDDVKKAFLSLSRKVHPDKNPEHIDLATRAFQRLQVLKAAIEDALVQPWAQPTPTADREASSAERQHAQAWARRQTSSSAWQDAWERARETWGPGYHEARREWERIHAEHKRKQKRLPGHSAAAGEQGVCRGKKPSSEPIPWCAPPPAASAPAPSKKRKCGNTWSENLFG